MMETPKQIEVARSFIGRPFMHQQRAFAGIDCAGLIKVVGDRTGQSFEDVSAYRAEPNKGALRAAVRRNLGEPVWEEIEGKRVPRLYVGGVALLKFVREGTHLAFIGNYLYGGFSIIHAYESGANGKVVETRLDSKWRSKIEEVYAWPA